MHLLCLLYWQADSLSLCQMGEYHLKIRELDANSDHCYRGLTFFFFLIDIWLIYNVMLISGVQDSDSVTHTYIFITYIYILHTYIYSFHILFHYVITGY